MLEKFPNENFTKVAGVDGSAWGNGELSDTGRPKFKDEYLELLLRDGVLTEWSLNIWPWIPAEVGCAFSHMRAWRQILDEKNPWTIVLEDDVAPSDILTGTLQEGLLEQVGIPDDAEVIFLHGPSKEYEVVIDEDNRLLRGWGNMGYAISLPGAVRALESMVPMYLPCDIQWWARAFKGLNMYINIPEPMMEKGQAYAMTTPLIALSKHSYISTLTESGKKPWKRLPY
jgi:GR25 family glycosyltransferase involved in LPS biosynthesis